MKWPVILQSEGKAALKTQDLALRPVFLPHSLNIH